MKRFTAILTVIIVAMTAMAQMSDPVHFTSELKMLENGEGELVFKAIIDPGWHVYSTDLGDDGPTAATLYVEHMDGAVLVGKLTPAGNEIKKHDKLFDMELRYFEQTAMFKQKVRFTKTRYTIDCYLEYGACNDKNCLPPSSVELKVSGDSPAFAKREIEEKPETEKEREEETVPATDTIEDKAPVPLDSLSISQTLTSAPTDSLLWQPITDELRAFGETTDEGTSHSLWYIFLSGLVGGFLAILTPCVWPIIPMTVSFFLKRNKERGKAIREATTYGLSIVIIYVLLGLLVTLLFGASALNALSTNAVFNILFALMLIVFAASFFGAFELTLPASWSTKIDQKSDELSMKAKGSNTLLSILSSHLSIFLMAFTLALVSFSCTGPIIGFLLVAVSTQGDIIAPTIGMLGFAIALAIPFTLFALFPSLLKQAPRSGSWMHAVKVVLGFIELAFALKFLSVADLAYGWHLLDREVFLSLWIVIFGLLGIYLVGGVPLSSPKDDGEEMTTARKRGGVFTLFLGILSLAFAVYMVPGLWGAPLKAISAFAPPMNTQDFNLYQGSVEAQYTDYDLGMEAARREGKPVMVDFTGYGCVNCRKMEAAVWTDPQVQELLNDRYVLISLYVDDKTPLPQPIEVTENGQTRRLRTVGDRWSYLQRTKVGMNTQPCYVLLDPTNGKPLNALRSYNEDIEEYVKFLKEGLRGL